MFMRTLFLLSGLILLSGVAEAQCAHPLGEDPCDSISDPEERELCQLGVDCTDQSSDSDSTNTVPELDADALPAAVLFVGLGAAALAPRRRR